MKKLKKRLERRIANLMSNAILWCDGRDYFKGSNNYRLPFANTKFFIEIIKHDIPTFTYHATITKNGVKIMEAEFVYDIFRRDVPLQRAYELKGLYMMKELDNIPNLKLLLGMLKGNEKDGTEIRDRVGRVIL